MSGGESASSSPAPRGTAVGALISRFRSSPPLPQSSRPPFDPTALWWRDGNTESSHAKGTPSSSSTSTSLGDNSRVTDAAVDAALFAVASSSPAGGDVISRALAVIADSRRAYEEGLLRGLPARTPMHDFNHHLRANGLGGGGETNNNNTNSSTIAGNVNIVSIQRRSGDDDEDNKTTTIASSTTTSTTDFDSTSVLRHPPSLHHDSHPALHRPPIPTPPIAAAAVAAAPTPIPIPLSVLSFGGNLSRSSSSSSRPGTHIPLGYAARIPSLRPQPEAVAAEEALRAATMAATTSNRAPTPPSERAARAARAAALRVSIDGGLTAALEQLHLSSLQRSNIVVPAPTLPLSNNTVSTALDSLRLPAGYATAAVSVVPPPTTAGTTDHLYASAETIAFEDPDVTVARLRRRLAAVDDAYAPTLAPYTAAYVAGSAALAAAAAAAAAAAVVEGGGLPTHYAMAERLRASVVLRAVDAAEVEAAAADVAAQDAANLRLRERSERSLVRSPARVERITTALSTPENDTSRLFLSPDVSLAGYTFSDDVEVRSLTHHDAAVGLSSDVTQSINDSDNESETTMSIAEPLISTALLLERLRGARIAAEVAAIALSD